MYNEIEQERITVSTSSEELLHETESDSERLQFNQLLILFDKILEQSEDYHIVHFPKLGYIAIDGKYMPGCKSDTVLSKIMFQQYFPTPKDMAYSLMENLRWQWYMQNGRPVCPDAYQSILEMDNELSESEYPEYFQMLKEYELEIDKIIGGTTND